MKVFIDNRDLNANPGETVLQLALRHNIVIPYMCYYPELAIAGSCRVCMVEVSLLRKNKEGVVKLEPLPKLQIACNTEVSEGMAVNTTSSRVMKARKSMMEFYLLSHPLDCPTCDQAGECKLQDYTYDYHQQESRFLEEKIVRPKKNIGNQLLLYPQRCIMCSRCVRFEKQISGNYGITILDRGAYAEIDVFPGRPLDHQLSMNIADICPVGAFVSKDFLFKQRVWFLKSTDSICPGCSRGCNISVEQNNKTIYRIKPRYNAEINSRWMCDIGRLTYHWLYDRARLTEHEIRKQKVKAAAVIDELASVLTSNKNKVGIVVSPFMTNEELKAVKVIADHGSFPVMLRAPNPEADTVFPKFVISGDRTPNRAGVMQIFAGNLQTFDPSKLSAVILFDYSPILQKTDEWAKVKNLIVVTPFADTFMSDNASMKIAGKLCFEKPGSFVNNTGKSQSFPAVLPTPGISERDLLTAVYQKLSNKEMA